MNIKEVAAKFDSREYGGEITREEEALLRKNGIVVMFGASDDLVELRGAIREEVGVYDGGEICFADGKLLENQCEEDDCPYFEQLRLKAHTIKAIWCGDSGYSWAFETNIPHETFGIEEDGEKYCRGILFSTGSIAGFAGLKEGS